MQSNIPWDEIKNLFANVKSCSMATVDEDGTPRVSPIGSVFLSNEGRGHYFEHFPKGMRNNLDRDPRLAIMAVHPGMGYWFRSLWRGRFVTHPALRLICEASKRRKATQTEIDAWMAKVRPFKYFKGHDLLWKNMDHLREFKILRVEPVNLGRMTP